MPHSGDAERRMTRAAALGAAIVALSIGAGAPAVAEAPPPGPGPEFCEMVGAFDRALQLRFYNANFAPTTFGCSFVGAEGCAFEAPREVVIRVTHVRDLGCDAETGECRFQARQVCEGELKALVACTTFMQGFSADYEVAGQYRQEGGAEGAWRLDDWWREPAPAVVAEEYDIAKLCPSE